VVETSPGLGDRRGVGQHADGTLNLGEIASGNDGGWLVVDTDLEASRAPVDELDRPLGLDGRDGGVNVLRDDVASVQHAASHVLSVTRIAFDHLVGWLEAGVGDLADGELLVVGFLGGDNRGVGDQGEVDTRVGHEIGLELGEIDVEGTVESQRSRDRRDDLSDESVGFVYVGLSMSRLRRQMS